MHLRVFTGAAVSLVWVAWVGAAGAADTFRLTGVDAPTMTLGLKGEADTVPVGWRGGYYRRSYRPVFSSYYRRGFYRGYSYPGYFNFGITIGRPFSYYYPPVYSAPAYYPPSYYPAPYYNNCPTIGDAAATLSATIIRPRNRTYVLQPPREMLPPPTRIVPGDGSYRYDGGPMNPVPRPEIVPPSPIEPPVKGQINGRVASLLPVKISKFAYPAYGDQPAHSSFAASQTIPVKVP